MIVLAYLGSQCAKFHAIGWTCWFLTSFIWSHVSDAISWWIWQQTCFKFCANLRKCAMEILAVTRQAFREGSMIRTMVFEWHVLTHCDLKWRDRWKAKSRACSSLFFDIRGTVHNLAGQTVNSTYYCDVLKWLNENVRRLHPELWRENKWLLHHNNAQSHTSFFTKEFLDGSLYLFPHTMHKCYSLIFVLV
jgi:hypothetical protein